MAEKVYPFLRANHIETEYAEVGKCRSICFENIIGNKDKRIKLTLEFCNFV